MQEDITTVEISKTEINYIPCDIELLDRIPKKLVYIKCNNGIFYNCERYGKIDCEIPFDKLTCDVYLDTVLKITCIKKSCIKDYKKYACKENQLMQKYMKSQIAYYIANINFFLNYERKDEQKAFDKLVEILLENMEICWNLYCYDPIYEDLYNRVSYRSKDTYDFCSLMMLNSKK